MTRGWMVCFVLLALGVSSSELGAQVEGSADDRVDVTAVSLTVDIDEVGFELSPADLEVLEDGTPQTLLSVERAGAAEASAVPWQIVLYVDRRLADRRSLRRTAAALAPEASRLVELGNVQILAAETELEQLLEPTRDAATLRRTLDRLAKKGQGRGELMRIRRQFLRDASETDSTEQLSRLRSAQSPGGSSAPRGVPGGTSQAPQTSGRESGARSRMLARGAAIEEAQVLDHQLDLLNGWVSRQRFPGPRALILVNDGFDVDPRDFYLRAVPERDEAELSGVFQELSMENRVQSLGQLMAAQGWTVLSVAVGESGGGLPGNASRQRASSDSSGGGLEDSLRKPKFLFARALEPLAGFAEASGGELITSEKLLPQAVADLGRRWRVTYQVDRAPDGQIHDVEVRLRQLDGELSAPQWIASETLEEIAFARARGTVEGGKDWGDMPLRAAVFFNSASQESRSDGPRQGTLAIRAELVPLAGFKAKLQAADVRVSLVIFYPERQPFTHHQVLRRQDLSQEGTWDFSSQVNLPGDAARVVVVVEELSTGAWGAATAPLMTRGENS